MAYDEKLADRVREMIAESTDQIEEKKMFGGLCFMVRNKMCVAVSAERIMIRLSPEEFAKAEDAEGFEPMRHGGRMMSGFGYIDAERLKTKKQLSHWLSLALDYNASTPAKAMKKTARKKK